MAIYRMGLLTLPARSMGQVRKSLQHDSHIILARSKQVRPVREIRTLGAIVAGVGNGFTVRLLRHSQRKRGATARLDLRISRQSPTLPNRGQ